jgi:signal transduction histidine kinase
MTSNASEVDARWLLSLQRLVGRAAHELKGSLNGVSINLEVIRSRVERPDTNVSAVSPFAVAAAAQLDDLISLNEALLGLTRAAPEPVDVGVEARRIAILLGAAARADGREFTISAMTTLGATSAPGSAVRLAICESMRAAVDGSASVRCAAVAGAEVSTMTIESDGTAIAVDPSLVATAHSAGIEIRSEHSAISIAFPR